MIRLMSNHFCLCLSLTVDRVIDLSFLACCKRHATALMTRDQDENLDSLSTRLTYSDFVGKVCAFLTSGSPVGSSGNTSVGISISLFHRNLGQENQSDKSNSSTVFPFEALSAGISSVAT